MERTALKQKAEYTHKFNRELGRHGWLRLTPAYSVRIVEELLDSVDPRARVLDPFSGTGTTGVCAAFRGHDARMVDVNPFLVWLGNAKSGRYSEAAVKEARAALEEVLARCRAGKDEQAPIPNIHNIFRWWEPCTVAQLASLRSSIWQSTRGSESVEIALLVAFCRTLIRVSNAAFNHQSMSFKDSSQSAMFEEDRVLEEFQSAASQVIDSLAENPSGHCQVILGDSRNLASSELGSFDSVITSPPYPNRMSYIRELRPYMYWLGYLRQSREAAELDWQSIGGTWGVATSRLGTWESKDHSFKPPYLVEILEAVKAPANGSGHLLANYIEKYFEDMWSHLNSLCKVLDQGACVNYVVGNSTFYKVLLPVERLFADMFAQLGFWDVQVRALRKRNSKKELVEFNVSARWGG